MKIDQDALEDYGLLLLKIKMFPYFDIAHYVLMCLAVRDDIHLHQPSNNSCQIHILQIVSRNTNTLCSSFRYSQFSQKASIVLLPVKHAAVLRRRHDCTPDSWRTNPFWFQVTSRSCFGLTLLVSHFIWQLNCKISLKLTWTLSLKLTKLLKSYR